VILLKRQILDKQIVDINDKKLVRVNDVRLAFLQSGSFPVAVDVGLTGLLRRLGVVEMARSLFGMVDRAVPSRLILWQDIGVLSEHSRNIKLSVTAQKLHTLHASDLSDIIEELDIKTRAAVFGALDHEKAADVLEEMEVEAKVSLLEELTVESVSDVLDLMPHDEVADILDDLPEERAEAILAEMDKDASHQIRELMEYPEHTAGSLMSTEFVAFGEDVTTECVLRELRRLKPDPDAVYSIYIVDEDGRLVGVSTLRDIVIASPEQPLAAYMDRKPIFVMDQDDIGSMAEVLAKYSLLALPVVEKGLSLVGSIIIDDVVAEILKTTKVRI
jgi:Mg/Co/Ni transporter MgtE